jgi:hypothetical protein
VRGAEERVGHEPLEGVVVLEDEPAAVRPEHWQREDAPLSLSRRAASQSAANCRQAAEQKR